MVESYKDNTPLILKEVEKYSDRLHQMSETLLNIRDEDIALAPTPKELVFKEDKVALYRFVPKKKKLCPTPLLITYALVNRETMMDLERGRSLISNLLDLGIDIYIIVWGYPSRMDRFLSLDDYINGYINDCVNFILKLRGLKEINLMGVCQGGTLSAIYASLYPDKTKNLVTMVAPFDFMTDDGLLNIWSRSLDADLMVNTLGNIPGDLMNLGFLMLKPFQLLLDKYVGFVENANEPAVIHNFLKMEKWIFDSPDQTGEAFRQFINDLYKENKLIKGELLIGDSKVDLKNITMPVLNLYAELDHLVPPSSTTPLKNYISSDDITTKGFPVGHIGMYVSSKAQNELAPVISEWLHARSAIKKRKKSKNLEHFQSGEFLR